MADHKRKKKRGRSKLFKSCFRSFAPEGERPLSYHKSKIGKPPVSGRKEEDFIPDVDLVNAEGDDRLPQRSSNARGIPRFVKAVLFDSLMVKKTRSSSKSSIGSENSDSFLSIEKPTDDDGNAFVRESTDMEDFSSRSSNLLSSSSSRTTASSYTSSSSSSSRTTASSTTDLPDSSLSNSSSLQKPNLIKSSSRSSQTDSIHSSRQDTSISLSLTRSSSYHNGLSQLDSVNLVSSNKLKYGCNNCWCLFLVLSLVVLVTYGRIYSILCTSIWFYLLPSRRVKRVNSGTNTARFVIDTESEQYKKRVIMAGLLDRTRNPLSVAASGN